MSDCCNDFPIACAPKAPGGCNPCGPCKPPRPCPPPAVKPGTSMYIGARYVPIFADPVEWDDEREYEPLTIVVHNGDCYTSKCYVPKGAQLPVRPENQNTYWVRTSDYNYQFEELRQAVVDLSKQVEKFAQDNKDFTAQMQAWNTTMQEWNGKLEDWGQTMDQFNTRIEAVENGLTEEIARAKAAEAANTAAIAQETADRKQAVSDLDAAYKAADAAEAQAREDADTALGTRITANKTDIDAIKAEQAIQNTNISANAKNISDNAAEIAKHAARLTDLESNASDWDDVFPDTTIAQEVQKEELARANADTALNGRCDTLAADVEEVRDLANHKIDTTTYTAGQAAQDAKITAAQAAADKANTNIGDWETDHPSQTISQCVTSLKNEQAATDAKADANTAALANKADKSEIPDVSGLLPKTEAAETYQPKGEYVTDATYTAGQKAQDDRITALENAGSTSKPSVVSIGSLAGKTAILTGGNAIQTTIHIPNLDVSALAPAYQQTVSVLYGGILVTDDAIAEVTATANISTITENGGLILTVTAGNASDAGKWLITGPIDIKLKYNA